MESVKTFGKNEITKKIRIKFHSTITHALKQRGKKMGNGKVDKF